MVELENLAETRLKAISVLETQKFDLVQDLHVLQQKNVEMEDKLTDMALLQNEQVCSEMKSVQLEEQIDKLTASKKELELVIENLKLDKEQLNGIIKLLKDEKEELNQKLEHYIQENIELTDKLEKLSAEKVSSAESIEIVESLTTQEKLELEEYNKGMIENKIDDHIEDSVPDKGNENIEKLVEESAELNRKIELFTQERQEVMEKMTKISTQNELLQKEITELNNKLIAIQRNNEILNTEKHELQTLNDELSSQIEQLKRERIEIIKESEEIAKPTSIEETAEATSEVQQDDKLAGDKGVNRNKSVKQLTKEILKLKNTIKEREAEIADCQMKILSLEEQQQKQNEIIQSNASYESKMKSLIDENLHIKEELDILKKNKQSEHYLLQLKRENDLLQQEMQKIQQECSISINTRDTRLQELENLSLEYEKQMFNYENTLQQKDKERTEYINQISKLNDVSQKLKSTIELLEEEKAKDHNAELVKTLNKQITAYQKKLIECEDKLKNLEEEKTQLLTVKATLENKNSNLDVELRKVQEIYAEKQNLIKEMQTQQQKHADEMSNILLETKERDEEIHAIKLQLRKESIENEKLRTSLSEQNKNVKESMRELTELKEKLLNISLEKDQINERYIEIESKNKELLEKLKKFAVNIKKKSTKCIELENQLVETQKQLEEKNQYLEQLLIQVDTLPALQEKLKHAEEELNRLQSQKIALEQQKSQSVTELQTKIKTLDEELIRRNEGISMLKDELDMLHKELNFLREENTIIKVQIDTWNKKLVEYEIEQKNNMNLLTKNSSLETEINQKQIQIAELLQQLENHEQQMNQIQFGYDAKVQERDLYIESLETEISKYKSRICRLEESISIMEDRRHFLESKADQLGSQLQEKQKAYNEYTNQEDELVNRLANLMDHDRVVEKQLHEIESESKELHYKIQHLSDENQRLRKSLSDIQDHCSTLVEKASRTDLAESEVVKYQTQLREVETHLKRITFEHQTLLMEKKQTIEDLESEFNTQIENAIKDKKALSEKYEKVNEHVAQLELKLQEYKSNIQNLNMNLEELSKINQELIKETDNKKQTTVQDYTEQYISEINKLNSAINSKNEEICQLNIKIQNLQTNNSAMISNLESKITQLAVELQHSSTEKDNLMKEINYVSQNNNELQSLLSQKDEQIKQLMDKIKVSFEMKIPKTEGMTISSTIEAIGEESKEIDISSIESEIVSDNITLPCPESKHSMKRTEQTQKQSSEKVTSSEGIMEPVITPKKAYICYKKEDVVQEGDPFNSDEGWGLGDCEEIEDVTPGLSHLNEQIKQLKRDNDALKTDFDTSNTKLLKALKKIKELKTKNDMLTYELKISKQISQSSFLDSAIEDELRNNIQELEKKIEELNMDLSKEKREKEALRKQNEVFNNANDRLTEMKEKLENEIELWKFKFKEANDKISTLQWGADTKDSPEHKTFLTNPNAKDTHLKEEIIKLEKENDELQVIVDQLTSKNKELLSQNTNLREELNKLRKELQQLRCNNCENIKTQLLELQNTHEELLKSTDILKENCTLLNKKLQEVSESNTKLFDKNNKLEEEVSSLKLKETESKNKILSLNSDLENIKTKQLFYEEEQVKNNLNNVDNFTLIEKFTVMEEHCLQLKMNLDGANKKIKELEIQNEELTQKSKEYVGQIDNLNAKIQNLDVENDQLLSTVAELRSSVSTAVDQRGFEIAELWKQHLAQREADFQKTEHELRSQLIAFESKYEQLLDNVQSSSQEETNKLVMAEQVSSLQNKLQDKEEHLHNLQDKYADVMNQLDMLRSEMEDEKLIHENKLLGQQEEYEKQIQQLTEKNHQFTENYEQTFKNIQVELTTTRVANDELKLQIEDLTNKLKESEAKILDLSNQLRIKDSEIYQKTHDFTITLAQRNEEFENVRKQLMEYEKKVEDLSYEKESELAILRLKMHEHNEHYEKIQKEFEVEKTNLTDSLNTKIIECTNLNKQITDLNQILEEHSNRSVEMHTALENQELEIVTLKDEISSLQDMIKSSNRKIQKHVTFASDTKSNTNKDEEKSEVTLNKELLDAVPRAELDLALYMLHQRDVRCEELTMELTQLLEERDTLQLRLSDSLRSNEELKFRCKSAGLDFSVNSSQETISELPSFGIEKEQQFVDTHRGQTSRSSSISDADNEKPKLQAKLSELRSVKHSRDVRLRQDSEQRQLDMRLLQRDVANLPLEAVDQLTQAHHTLSRDSQNTSTVLLNWLRGKSTPKVVHM